MCDNKNYYWPFLGNAHQKRLWKFNSTLVQTGVFGLAKLWSTWPLNKKVLYNSESFVNLIENRAKELRTIGRYSKPIITVCNHRSCIDDPLVWGALLKWRHVASGQMRWIPTAAELTFFRPLYSFFFGHGRCVPVVRGQGVYQQGADFCVDRLNQGDWLHLFPEGKVNLDNSRRLKWGIGRMIADSETTPDVIPIWLLGMDDVLPNKRPYIPRLGQTMVVYVGETINMEDRVKEWKQQITDPMLLRKKITDYVEEKFWALQEEATSHHRRMTSDS